MTATPQALSRLIQSVRAVRDAGLHTSAVERFLDQASPGEVVESLRLLMTDIDRPFYRPAYHAVVQYIVHDTRGGQPRPIRGLQEIYRAAYGAGYDPVRMLLLRAPALLIAAPEDVLPDPELLDVPLGRRKAMARGRDRDLLLRLSMDPSPPVVEILLGNPMVVERDVIRVASRRPNMAEVLEIVAGHVRWSQRYKVQETLVYNPYTPCSLAAALVPFLTHTHLATVARDLRLHEQVRASAETVTRWRQHRRGHAAPVPDPAETH